MPPIGTKGKYREFIRYCQSQLKGDNCDFNAEQVKCGLFHVVILQWINELPREEGEPAIIFGISDLNYKECATHFVEMTRAQERGNLDAVKKKLSENLKNLKTRLRNVSIK